MIGSVLFVVTVVMIYLGFAGISGSLLRRFRSDPVTAVLSLGLILLPAGLGLPLETPESFVVIGAGIVTCFVYLWQPGKRHWFCWKPDFAFYYYGTVMLFILAWSASAGELSYLALFGLPATIAGSLGWSRAVRS